MLAKFENVEKIRKIEYLTALLKTVLSMVACFLKYKTIKGPVIVDYVALKGKLEENMISSKDIICFYHLSVSQDHMAES